ncbi:MAG TPA: hypothetical protein VNZ53_39975 [Steroidobacteraceae bacterium]|nr:hypothetical protein [Steroidobacteraceae bacterium]
MNRAGLPAHSGVPSARCADGGTSACDNAANMQRTQIERGLLVDISHEL